MGRLPGLLIFILIVLSVLTGLHYYLWLRLIRDPHWAQPWRAIATGLLVLAAVSIPCSFALRRTSPSLLRLMLWPALTWIGLMFLLTVTLVAGDLLRLLAGLARRVGTAPPLSPERRVLFAQWIAGGGAAIAGGLGAVAIRSALNQVAIRRVEIPLARLAAIHDGITIVQLTDLHIGPTIGKNDLMDVVRRTNAISPDIIAITGDLVDGTVAELRDAVSPLADLKAKHGVFFVTGNHEYFSGAAAWVDEIGRLGIRVLRNERVGIGTADVAFDLAGVDDRSAARFSHDGHGEDLSKALAGRDRNRAVILLAHQPRTVIDAAKYSVDLQLSGHTHGGQIWPFGVLVSCNNSFWRASANTATPLSMSAGEQDTGARPCACLRPRKSLKLCCVRQRRNQNGTKHGRT